MTRSALMSSRAARGSLRLRAYSARRICFSLLFLFALAALRPAFAQVATGTPPFGSFAGGPDTVNLSNLNTHFTIPVFARTGRGMNFSYDLSYDSSVWYPVGSTWQPVTNWGWRGVTEIATGYISYSAS